MSTYDPRSDQEKLDDVIRVVGRIVRESTTIADPYDPITATGTGSAHVDWYDLTTLANRYHEYIQSRFKERP